MAVQLPSRASDYAGWYNTLVQEAGLAEHSPVRGCMVIKPYGYAIWEKMQSILDKAFKATGHENAYFPMLIPKHYLSKEADHIANFAKECAVVTHYRLKQGTAEEGMIVDPAAQLAEEVVIRPTSETIVWNTYKNWIRSYRDLPILINQWSNIVRWEMRPRLFLRTAEVIWQEGHTAHATRVEALEEALRMLDIYYDFAKQYMAMPLLKGTKTAHEKFPGAEQTYTIEALMQDGKALQAGTSHLLGQNFSRAFDVTFTNQAGELSYVWGTSWGITTRLIGALIMTHGDDQGLVLPPRLAPIQVVIIPIYTSPAEKTTVVAVATAIQAELEAQGITVRLDARDQHKPGWKFAEYERKGVPVRLVLGPRDLQRNTVELTRRDTGEKHTVSRDTVTQVVQQQLQAIQDHLYQRALRFQEAHTVCIDTYAAFKEAIAAKQGFVMAYWDGETATEKQIQAETKATIRCIPWEPAATPGTCIYTGKPATQRVAFAQAY
ncbi:MAG: proline--tRNA ligase [Bacteroidota bacterium]